MMTVSLTGSPTRRTLVASLGRPTARLPMAPVNPGSSPSPGRGRTFNSTGSDSSKVYRGSPPGIVAGPVTTTGPEKRLPAVQPAANPTQVAGARPPGTAAGPVPTPGREKRLPAVKPCANTLSLPAITGVRVV